MIIHASIVSPTFVSSDFNKTLYNKQVKND